MNAVSPSRVAIVIASVGRPVELGRWAEHARRQTVSPAALVYAVARESDLPPRAEIPEGVIVLFCDPGLPIQRNRGLEAVQDRCDIIAYFDDDYVPSRFTVEGIDAFFRDHPEVAGINGALLADGINSPGTPYEEAARLVDERDAAPRADPVIFGELPDLYGCNMIYRISAIGDERFDETLPLYAWQEDVDFAARIRARGRLVKTDAFWGVHQGMKGGRLSGVRLGYSQVVNPIYVARRGNMRMAYAAKLISKNILINHARAFFPEPWIDRLGRAKGNWLGIIDVVRRKDDPRRILSLKK